jgi:monosaccharide-transporting ATPase
MSVLFISAEIEEVLRLSHKVEVLRDRHLVAEFANENTLTIDELVQTIAGGAAA